MHPPIRTILAGAALLASAALAPAQTGTTHPYPGGAEADLWVLAGQSNMQGYGVRTKEYPPNPKIMMFDLSNAWMPAVPPTHRLFTNAAPVLKKLMRAKFISSDEAWDKAVAAEAKKPNGGVGPDWSFAESLVRATGHNVGLLPCAFGGTSMAEWSPAGLGQGSLTLYGNMMERIRAVGGKIKGVLWYQGEAETGSQASADSYQATFLDWVDSVRRDTGIPDLPIIYVQISRFCLEHRDYEPFWQTVQEKQRTAAALRKNLWVVSALDLPLDDLIHIGEAGQERLGRRLAEVALTHVYQIKGHGTPLDFHSYEILPASDVAHNRMRVTLSGVTGRLVSPGRPTGFEMRSDDPHHDGPTVFKVELDASYSASVILWYSKPITAPVRLYYGLGMNPYVNLTDSADMAVPAFGPITVQPKQ